MRRLFLHLYAAVIGFWLGWIGDAYYQMQYGPCTYIAGFHPVPWAEWLSKHCEEDQP